MRMHATRSLTHVSTSVCTGTAASIPGTCRMAPSTSSTWPTMTLEPTNANLAGPSNTATTPTKRPKRRTSPLMWLHGVSTELKTDSYFLFWFTNFYLSSEMGLISHTNQSYWTGHAGGVKCHYPADTITWRVVNPTQHTDICVCAVSGVSTTLCWCIFLSKLVFNRLFVTFLLWERAAHPSKTAALDVEKWRTTPRLSDVTTQFTSKGHFVCKWATSAALNVTLV